MRHTARALLGALAVIIAGGGLAALPVAAANESPLSPAQKKALTNCSICHDITPKKTKLVGPPLFGVFGSKPTIEGVPFDKWDQAALDKWLTDPAKVKPGTNMSFSMSNAKKRAETIAALQALK
jgi:cytochrome c